MSKPFIDALPLGHELEARFSAIKESIEVIHGERGSRISKLDPDEANLDDVINKVNEIITLLQG